MKLMSKRDWETYTELYKNMVAFLKKPDLIVYLSANTNVLIGRIENRNRKFEKKIDSEYLHRLNLTYEGWINSIEDIPVLTINTNEFNVFKDKNKLNSFLSEIENFI